MIWIAYLVDLCLYALVGTAIWYLGRKRLPDPWNNAGFIIPLVVAAGAILSMITMPNWIIAPK